MVDATPPFARALRTSTLTHYSTAKLRADLIAGLVVGIVALPLSLALAIASGVPPRFGLYTAIVSGAIAALTGGARTSITGPTAAFVVILAPISARYGIAGLLVATALAGVIQTILGVARLGRLISFVPHPVTTGFTAGIAVVIATLQIEHFLGLTLTSRPEHYSERVAALSAAMPTLRPGDVLIGLLTLATLVVSKRLIRKIPAPLVGVIVGTAGSLILAAVRPELAPSSIGSRYGAIPQGLPSFVLPWLEAGPDGQPLGLSWNLLRELVPSAFAIAMLGAIESLLCAVVADAMTGDKHDSDSELLGQGLANIIGPFFGGFAATGAIARTATNIGAGGRTPVAAVVHSLVVLIVMLALAPWLSLLPMAALAALLLVVAWNMSELRHVKHILKVAPRSDKLVLVTCFLLTVIFDMVVSVTAGVLLAALLFMRRMASLAGVRLVESSGSGDADNPAHPGVIIYEIAGPMFFGAAQRAMEALQVTGQGTRAIILDMRAVPVMDSTGIVNLASALERLTKQDLEVGLVVTQAQPLALIERAHLLGPRVHRFENLGTALTSFKERPPEGPPAAGVH